LSDTLQRLLIIDDDPSLLDVLVMALEDEGYSVATASDGKQGMAAIEQQTPDLVICDVNMPELDGFTLCRRLREAQNHVPLIMLTSRDNEVDEALGFELGADDYVAKPFSTRILLARVRSLLRRERLRRQSQGGQSPGGQSPGGQSLGDERLDGEAVASTERAPIEVGQLTLEPDRLEATYAGEPLSVTVTEFRLLEVFARRPGIVFSRQQLLDRIRGDDSVVADRLVDTYVRRLRRKFEAIQPAFHHIETVIGAGYKWRK
jgi:DNA-binding response OmpR family regulator